jgi:DNA segregation ATPase FtsK/SpoIIIE, S-DNA-T family
MTDRPAPFVFPWFAVTVLAGGFFISTVVLSEPLSGHPSLPGLYPQPFADLGDDLREAIVEPLGAGAWVFAFGWLAVSIPLHRRRWWKAIGRAIGWTILTGCGSVLADGIDSNRLSGPLPGNGGSVGAVAADWLNDHLPPIVAALALVIATAAGVFFAADHVVTWLARRLWRTLRRIARLIRLTVGGIARLGKRIPVAERIAFQDADEAPVAPLESVSIGDTVVITRTPRPDELPRPRLNALSYELPPVKLLDEPAAVEGEDEGRLRDVASLLEKTFADFGLKVKVVGIHTGPVVTQYEIALETGLRVNKVTALSDDLALNLRVPSVRIVAPIPGKNTVGIEVPNEHRAVVRLKELLAAAQSKVAKSKLPLLLGKDSEGRPLVYDLADMPHLLIAGRTGTGKSVCLNSIILSLLLTRTPDECRLLMIDPKQVELAEYGKLPHLMHPVVTDNTKAEAILAWAVDKMEERYDLMRKARVRNIAGFNELGRAEVIKRVKPAEPADADLLPDRLPYIVIIVDEVGDLMMAMKKEVEGHIIRLAQKSRAAGIHLILTTQRPTVDVITGLIKSNLPARVCFQVADRSNSRVVLDEVGAEKLLGKGDMLFLQPNTSTIVRAQGSYASDQEILRIVGRLEVENPEFDNELLNLESRSEGGEGPAVPGGGLKKRDPLYEQAVEVVVREGRGSVSLLQRALGIGYGRSARLIDFMAEDGIVGTYNGAQAREVLISSEQWAQMRGGAEEEFATES